MLAFRAVAHGLDRRRSLGDLGAVAGACGIQDTPPGNADVALAARLDLSGPVVADAVAAKRLVVTWSVRGAPHVVPVADLAVFSVGARHADGKSLEAVVGAGAKHLLEGGIDPADGVAEVEKAMVAALGNRQRTKGELSAAVTGRINPALTPWCRSCNAHHPQEGLFRAALLAGRMVLRATSPVTLVRTRTWLGTEPKGDVGRLRRELLVRYLHCYAPSTARDFAGWAGIGTAEARERWRQVEPALTAVNVEGRQGFVVEDDLERLAGAAPPDSVRLLPSKDVLLQARDRDLLIPDAARRKAVFAILGGPGVLLVGGDIAGTWRGAGRGRRYEVRVQPFGVLTTTVRRALEEEAQRVAAARGHDRGEVVAWA